MKSRTLLVHVALIVCYIGIIRSEEDESSCDFQTSGPENELTSPENCLSGSFAWHQPSGTVNITFPRSLLPVGHRRMMKVCLRPSGGAGLTEMKQLMRGRRGPRRGNTPLRLWKLRPDPTDDDETNPWMCCRLSRKAITLSLRADGEETEPLQGLDYRVEEVEHSRGPNKRPKRPKKTDPADVGRTNIGGGSRRGPNRRPGRRPGRKGPAWRGRASRRRGGKNTFPLGPNRDPEQSGNTNNGPRRNRGGKNTFPLGHGEFPMPSYLKRGKDRSGGES